MLFLVGLRSSQVAQRPLPGIACVHCGTPNAVVCAVFSRYLSLFFIPVIPVGKISSTECRHCKQVLRNVAQMPATYRPFVEAAQAQARTPLTHFALLFLFLALGTLPLLFSGGVLLLGKLGVFNPAARLDVPREVVGTRYVAYSDSNSPAKGYTLIQATKVTPDSVYCLITGGLRGPLTPATATVALRDSVNPLRGFALGEWQQMVGIKSVFKRL